MTRIGRDQGALVGIIFGAPVILGAFFLQFSRIFETLSNFILTISVILLIVGAFFIIRAKSSEALTSRWMQLGPPVDRKKWKEYFLGYLAYFAGIAIVLISCLAVH